MIKGLPALVWVEVKFPTVEVNDDLEVLDVPEPVSHLFNLPVVEPLSNGVGETMLGG
jgi:hypothetical protein